MFSFLRVAAVLGPEAELGVLDLAHATGPQDAVGRAVVWECPGKQSLTRRCRLGPGIAQLPICEGLAGGPPITASAIPNPSLRLPHGPSP